MELVYSGPHPEVVVDEFDSERVIKAGEPVEIPENLAARLLEQDTWSQAETPAGTPTAQTNPTGADTSASATTTKDVS